VVGGFGGFRIILFSFRNCLVGDGLHASCRISLSFFIYVEYAFTGKSYNPQSLAVDGYTHLKNMQK